MFVDTKKSLAIDSPYQTFAVGLLVEFIDWTCGVLSSTEHLVVLLLWNKVRHLEVNFVFYKAKG